MSSNLLKRAYTNVQEDETRVIDTNELVAKRIRELAEKMQSSENESFVSGLHAPVAEVEALLADGEETPPDQTGAHAGEEAEQLLEEARREAASIVEQAKIHAAQLEKDARARAEQERIQMLEQARQQGMQEGLEKADREAEKGRQELKAARRQLEEEYQQLSEELEPQFVDVITEVYEHIFRVELGSYKEVLSYLISATMRKAEGSRDFMIHVSREDYPYVSEQKSRIAAGAVSPNCSVEVIEDVTLSENECMIETEGGIFDCGLGTQLSELRRKLKLLSFEKKHD